MNSSCLINILIQRRRNWNNEVNQYKNMQFRIFIPTDVIHYRNITNVEYQKIKIKNLNKVGKYCKHFMPYLQIISFLFFLVASF